MGILSAIHIIAERRIEEAVRKGKLDVPEWRNRPLPMNDDHFVPSDLKMAYKILKNSGYLPPEIELRKEIAKLEDLIAASEDEHTRVKQIKKLNFMTMKLDNLRDRPSTIANNSDYHRRVTEKLTVKKTDRNSPCI